MLARLARRLAACGVLLLLSACGLPAPAPAPPSPIAAPSPVPSSAALPPPTETALPPSPTPAPTTVSLDAVQAALQSVVDVERRAIGAQSKDEYMSQIDPGDRDWSHFQQNEFADNAFVIGQLDCVSNVRLDPTRQTAQADVGLGGCPGRYHVGMFFRLVGTRWFHSQPAREEQGLRDTRKIGPFRVTFHAMDEGYLPVLERFAPGVFDRVSTAMQTRDLDVDVDLISRPTDMPRAAFTTIALYNPINRRMSMLSPFFWPNGDGTEAQLDDQIRVTLTHEFTHHAVRTLALLSVPHWFNEGTAVYVSGENPTQYVRLVEQVQIAGRLQPPDALNTLLQDGQTASLAYAEAYSFVHYLTAQKGDPVLPQILHALRDSGDLDGALRTATGAGLDSWWRAWLRSLNN